MFSGKQKAKKHMTELKPMSTTEVLSNLVPVSNKELAGRTRIALAKIRFDCVIISEFVASSRCPDDEDPKLYAEAERELKLALKTVQESLDSATVVTAYEGLVDRFVEFVDEIQPGLSGQLESKLLTT